LLDKETDETREEMREFERARARGKIGEKTEERLCWVDRVLATLADGSSSDWQSVNTSGGRGSTCFRNDDEVGSSATSSSLSNELLSTL
jgi:hypothetical protein